jgi:hypothetical protein
MALSLAPCALPFACAADGDSKLLQALMPRAEDYALMWWAEGFPAHTPEAPWRRVIQTGTYAMALDTETLTIPHFGLVPGGVGYVDCARSDNRAWQRLPPADLSLSITVNHKRYRCTAGGTWTPTTGPRLIESGRFVQRADVTDLVFVSDDGERLNAEARFETVAWPDRLGLILAARPGLQPLQAGEACFGRLGGGFGLTGANHLEFAHSPELDPERLSLELWAFVPVACQVSRQTHPWLVCKNHHEQAEGNYGIVIVGGKPQARMNIGGGREQAFAVEARPGMMKGEAWNHFVLSYDGDALRFYVNGNKAGEQQIGRKRVSGNGGLAFGRRQDNCGDGYYFRGAVDEIRLYDRALADAEVRDRYAKPESAAPARAPVREWSFRAEGQASLTQPREPWKAAEAELYLKTGGGTWVEQAAWTSGADAVWQEVSAVVEARDLHAVAARGFGAMLRKLFASKPIVPRPVDVQAKALTNGWACPVSFDAARGWHRIDLDGVKPVIPAGERWGKNDTLERVRLTLANPDDCEQPARLLFEKRAGLSITGVSALLRDRAGNPTGIPVQLSKNWHGRPDGGVYAGQWFHGFSQVRLPPRSTFELELTLAYGHWGGVAAASHAQLCLIGWGSNQLWDQSALGSWGESICYEPDQAQAHAAVLDVRPLMIRSMSNNAQWGWTHNVGGGDFFRLFDAAGKRVFPSRVRAAYQRQGPCLTEVLYAGRLGEGIEHSAAVSLGRTDDLVRGVYRLRLDVTKPVAFSRFVVFQIGADTYSYTGERKMALGNETGLLKEWDTQWGGDCYRTPPVACAGRTPWISLHEAVPRLKPGESGAWANRGVVIRSWRARLGGQAAGPWMAERGVRARGDGTSTADIVPPHGVTRLEPGDFVEATFEHLIVPQSDADYYGPNEALRAALKDGGNTWRMIRREAAGNERRVSVTKGRLVSLCPSVCVCAKDGAAEFTLAGGLGYVPVTFIGLTSAAGHALEVDGQPVDQRVHGNDFWQADYDPGTRRWSLTFNLPLHDAGLHVIRLGRAP